MIHAVSMKSEFCISMHEALNVQVYMYSMHACVLIVIVIISDLFKMEHPLVLGLLAKTFLH